MIPGMAMGHNRTAEGALGWMIDIGMEEDIKVMGVGEQEGIIPHSSSGMGVTADHLPTLLEEEEEEGTRGIISSMLVVEGWGMVVHGIL